MITILQQYSHMCNAVNKQEIMQMFLIRSHGKRYA